jgi:chorismate synthase
MSFAEGWMTMGSSFGRMFRVTTFGESHGVALGCVVDGCPPGVPIDEGRLQQELDRRRPGQSSLTTSRDEADELQILSGVADGHTLGTPIAMIVRNRDADPAAYARMAEAYRPSHADFSHEAKYGRPQVSGGGRASARETVARVAAGAVARQVWEFLGGGEVLAWVDRVHDVEARVPVETVARDAVERSLVRCPDEEAAAAMTSRILAAREEGDSVGGVVGCVARGVPAGLGEPVFDKLEADLAKALLSIPGCRAFEVGSGFAAAGLRGSEHNDGFTVDEAGRVMTTSNRSGGIQGGISNGMPIVLRAAFKAPSTIAKEQATVDRAGRQVILSAGGRHDPCVLPRAVPIVESMVCLVLVDHWLRWRGQVGGRSHPLEDG